MPLEYRVHTKTRRRYTDESREGLINSRVHPEFCFWGHHQNEFGGHRLFREPVGWAYPLADRPLLAPGHMFPTCPPRAAVVPRTDSPSHS